MKPVSIGSMIQQLMLTDRLSSADRDFIGIAAKLSDNGRDTSALDDSQVERVNSIWQEVK